MSSIEDLPSKKWQLRLIEARSDTGGARWGTLGLLRRRYLRVPPINLWGCWLQPTAFTASISCLRRLSGAERPGGVGGGGSEPLRHHQARCSSAANRPLTPKRPFQRRNTEVWNCVCFSSLFSEEEERIPPSLPSPFPQLPDSGWLSLRGSWTWNEIKDILLLSEDPLPSGVPVKPVPLRSATRRTEKNSWKILSWKTTEGRDGGGDKIFWLRPVCPAACPCWTPLGDIRKDQLV